QRPVRPWAGKRDIEMVAPRFRSEAAFACRSGRAVRGDPVAKHGFLAHESSCGRRSIVPTLRPAAIDENTHALALTSKTDPPALAVAQLVHQRFLLAAVDLDHGAVDEEGAVGGEERDEVGDLVGFGNPPQRNAGRRELVGLLVA